MMSQLDELDIVTRMQRSVLIVVYVEIRSTSKDVIPLARLELQQWSYAQCFEVLN